MRSFVSCLFAFLTVVAFAQTPEEILNRMSEVWDTHEPEGLIMTVDTKFPVVGTISMKNYSLGNKTRSETTKMGIHIVVWDDGVTSYSYTEKTNKVKIEDSVVEDASENGDTELFTDVTEGYDLSIKKETADSWLILCQKSKSNPDKDAPKKVEITVAKGTFYPMSLKTKMEGISLTMRDISFGVKEDFVTFRMEDYPNAIVEDKRDKGNK